MHAPRDQSPRTFAYISLSNECLWYSARFFVCLVVVVAAAAAAAAAFAATKMRVWSEQQAQERVARKDAEDDEAAAYWAYLQRVRDGTRPTLFNSGLIVVL